ncbi:MAG: hypothetical protein R3E42_12915 [Burkholderiaceae bacterium]
MAQPMRSSATPRPKWAAGRAATPSSAKHWLLCYSFTHPAPTGPTAATDVLGALIEVITEQLAGGGTKQAISDPLGMVDTGFWVPEKDHHRIAEPSHTTLMAACPCGCSTHAKSRPWNRAAVA